MAIRIESKARDLLCLQSMKHLFSLIVSLSRFQLSLVLWILLYTAVINKFRKKLSSTIEIKNTFESL